jgi:hypothetical protein
MRYPHQERDFLRFPVKRDIRITLRIPAKLTHVRLLKPFFVGCFTALDFLFLSFVSIERDFQCGCGVAFLLACDNCGALFMALLFRLFVSLAVLIGLQVAARIEINPSYSEVCTDRHGIVFHLLCHQ